MLPARCVHEAGKYLHLNMDRVFKPFASDDPAHTVAAINVNSRVDIDRMLAVQTSVVFKSRIVVTDAFAAFVEILAQMNPLPPPFHTRFRGSFSFPQLFRTVMVASL